jgi:hypothetical protein
MSFIGTHAIFKLKHDFYDEMKEYTITIGLDYCSTCDKNNNIESKEFNRCYIPCDFCKKYDEKCYHCSRCDKHIIFLSKVLKGSFPSILQFILLEKYSKC